VGGGYVKRGGFFWVEVKTGLELFYPDGWVAGVIIYGVHLFWKFMFL
jgi:hypothetical protein